VSWVPEGERKGIGKIRKKGNEDGAHRKQRLKDNFKEAGIIFLDYHYWKFEFYTKVTI
jgi:hypothetical protein